VANRRTPFFLPIARHSAAAFVEHGVIPEAPIERAALLAVSVIAKRPLTFADIHRLLSEAQDLFASDDPAAGAAELQRRKEGIGHETIDSLSSYLAEHAIVFAPDEFMADELWADAKERYTDAFQEQCREMPGAYEIAFDQGDDAEEDFDDEFDSPRRRRQTFSLSGTRDQAVAAKVIASAPDEIVAIDAYAGTGKTHLILALNSELSTTFTYVVPREAQLHALNSRADGHSLNATTLRKLANETAFKHARERGIWVPKWRPATSYETDLQSQVQYAAIPEIEQHNAVGVLLAAKQAINAWCATEDPILDKRHFKRALPFSVDATPYVSVANQLWVAMFARVPPTGAVFSISLSHLGKWLSLHQANIPISYGTLLVDEAHDLTPAWRYLFLRYQGGCVLMGDPYQRLQGRVSKAENAKCLTMSRSFRMGLHGDSLVDRTLSLAPERLVTVPFSGSRGHITRLNQHHAKAELPQVGLRIYGSEWALLEDALRIKDAGGRFRLLPATAGHLERTVRDATTLYRSNDTFRGARVSGCSTWKQLADLLEKQGRGKIIRLFERGFDEKHLDALLKAQSAEGEQRITLGLNDHAKNLEASTVALNECCFTDAGASRHYLPVHAAYLAMTRARDEIWLPGDALDRLGDLSRSS